MGIIRDAFAKNGLRLEEFKNEEGHILWQYDGFDHGSNVVVQIQTGRNGRGEESLFGEYHAEDGSVYSITGPVRSWMGEFGQYLPLMAKGEPLPF